MSSVSHIVCETEESAKNAISYLKKQPQQNSFFCIVNGNYFDEANQIIYEILIIKNHFLFVRKMNFMQQILYLLIIY